jgi:hypothetical protein
MMLRPGGRLEPGDACQPKT